MNALKALSRNSKVFNLIKTSSDSFCNNKTILCQRVVYDGFSKFNSFRLCAQRNEECETVDVNTITVTKPKGPLDSDPDLDLTNYGSALVPSYNFAAYADKSVVLQEFIKLGVELYKLEKDLTVAKFLIQLDFKKHVKPHLVFLHDHGVPADELGKFITRNPLIFKTTIEDMEVRINYLKSKRFTDEMISEIITKNPLWLSTPVKVIDTRLGFLQQTFDLKGDDIRKIITQVPRLGTVPKKQLMTNHYMLKEEMNLDKHQLKKLIVEMPVLLRKNEYEVMRTYEFLTKVMKVSREVVLKQPIILTHRVFLIRERHRYLEKLGRAQYNPFLPGYVPLISLATITDEEFCEKFAFTSVLSYNEFLKTQ